MSIDVLDGSIFRDQMRRECKQVASSCEPCLLLGRFCFRASSSGSQWQFKLGYLTVHTSIRSLRAPRHTLCHSPPSVPLIDSPAGAWKNTNARSSASYRIELAIKPSEKGSNGELRVKACIYAQVQLILAPAAQTCTLAVSGIFSADL